MKPLHELVVQANLLLVPDKLAPAAPLGQLEQGVETGTQEEERPNGD